MKADGPDSETRIGPGIRSAQRLRHGELLDDHYKDRLFRQPKEYELTYAGKESRGSILAGTMGVPLQVLRRFGRGDGRA